MKLRKVHKAPASSAPLYGPVSAIWETREIPGLWVRKLRWPAAGGPALNQWSVRSVEDNGEDYEDTDTRDLGYRISVMLSGEQWPTRKEALQAIQAARTFLLQGQPQGRAIPF